MNDATRDFVLAEWESSLGVDQVALRAGGVHVVSVDLGMNDAMSFLLEDACIVVVPAREVGAAREMLAGVDVAAAFTAGMLRQLVGSDARVDGPSVHCYLDLHSFTSVDESVAIEVSGEDSGLLDFLEGNDLADWGESGFPRDPSSADSVTTRFWVLPDGDGAVVAAGNLTEWRGLPADIGILTAPAERGRGHARRLVNAMMAEALPAIGIARYRALASNAASLAVARRLGFEEYGQNSGLVDRIQPEESAGLGGKRWLHCPSKPSGDCGVAPTADVDLPRYGQPGRCRTYRRVRLKSSWLDDGTGESVEPSGRLELTWTNKHLRLISDQEGGYEWVDPADPRVSEVRLLHDVAAIGDHDPHDDNLLIEGDALHALTALNCIPELAKRYAGQVRLVYIDPPFNTGQAFANYDDNLEHSVWLSMLRDRLIQIKPLLSPDSSIWVHLDDAEVHRCRCVMDEILGAGNFVSSAVWKRRNDPRNTARHISLDHDTLLIYARDLSALTFNKLERTERMDAAYTNPDDDHRGPWRRGDLAARNYYSRGLYAVTTPSGRVIDGPPSGSYWRVSEEELQRLDGDGRIYWGPNGDSRPYLKRFLSEVAGGRVPSSVWHPEEVGFVRNGKEEVRALIGDVFATPKPERLIERILKIGTDPGDLVLDCFAGSGTTAAVAHKMNRRWVTSETEAETVAKFIRPRLEQVVQGEDLGGITEAVEWKGGGGFRHLRVGASMFDLDAETGDVFLAEWATNGEFSEAVAAQLGFEQVDSPPFCGRKGRTRLAVLDGVVGAAEVEFLVAALDEQERVMVVGQAFTEDAESTLRTLSPGSRVRHAPHDLLIRGGRR